MCTDTLVQLLLPLESDLGILVLLFSRFLDFKFGVFQILEICSDKTSSIFRKEYLSGVHWHTTRPEHPWVSRRDRRGATL